MDSERSGGHHWYTLSKALTLWLSLALSFSLSLSLSLSQFVVGRDGQVLRRYGPGVNPVSLDVPDKLPAWLAEAAQ